MSGAAPDRARARWAMIVGVRIVAAIGAVAGVVLLARATTLPPRLIGIAWTLASLWVMGVVPAALAHRWRTPE